MKVIVVVWILAMVMILGPAMHDAYIWNQIEQQAVVADLVEGDQE